MFLREKHRRHTFYKDNGFLAENIKKQYLCRKSKRVKAKRVGGECVKTKIFGKLNSKRF